MGDRPTAIVVGTGFGGAVTAHRLVKAGLDVVVLERGRRYQGGDFPSLPRDDQVFPDLARWAFSPSSVGDEGGARKRRHGQPSHWSASQGLWEVRDLGDTIGVHAAGYGGGSLVYANVHLRAPQDAFRDGWPAQITRAALDPYYDRVAAKLDIKPITATPVGASLRKTRAFDVAAERLGRKTFYPPLAVHFGPPREVDEQRTQQACNLCGECDTGCRTLAKNTLDLNYLLEVDRGADVRTLAEVLWVSPAADGRAGYEVTYFDHALHAEREVAAKYVFLCAGSACSSEILLRSRGRGLSRLSERLGERFYGNSDSFAVVFDTDEPQEPGKGPTITTALVHQDADDWFMIQEGGYPAAMTRAVASFRARALLGRNAYPSKAPRPFDDPFTEPQGPSSGAPFAAIPDGLFAVLAKGDLLRPQSDVVPAALAAALGELRDLAYAAGRSELAQVVPAASAKMRERAVDRVLSAMGLAKVGWARRLGLRIAARVQAWLGGDDEALVDIAQQLVVERYAPTPDNAARVLGWLAGWEAEPSKPEHRAVLLSMGRDRSAGRYYLDERRELRVRLPLDPRQQTYSEQELLMRDLAGRWKGELRVNPLWAAARKPISVHQQGGCPMADSPDEGVVDPWGQVFGHPGLFVFDGAAMPRALGVNPSSTIAALAERNVQRFLESCGEPGVAFAIDADEQARIHAWRARSGRWALEPTPGPSPAFESQPIGVSFTEVMSGFHAGDAPARDELGLLHHLRHTRGGAIPRRLDVPQTAEPYEAAYRRGCPRPGAPGNTLSLTMHASIDDVVAFGADDRHRMPMRGTADFHWPDEHIAIDGAPLDGGASLFVPFPGSAYQGPDRIMLYELSFAQGDERWHVLGFKRMHHGEGARAWADTTNLFVTVWSEARDLVTEGVARLPMEVLLYEVIGKMRVTGTTDPARTVWAIATFGTVFFGHLAEIYLPAIERYRGLALGRTMGRHS